MKSSVIIITVLVLSIAVIAVVHAQASVGLEVSYEVHLQVAEQWVAKLNEYGINTTAVNQLISKAQVEASVGNYTEAIILLNQAVALSAQLMSNYLSNSTSVVMSNYASTVTDLNSHVEASLNNSNVTTSVLLKALGYVNGYVNSGNFSGALRTITLLNATINTAAAISPGISTTAQAVIPTLSRLYLELKGAEYAQNITAAQLALFRAEVLIVTEVVSKPVREEYLYSIISNWEHQLINE